MSIHKYNMGVIGNCSYIAYINMHADVKWMCLPKFDSSFLFGSLLDEKKGGHFQIHPATDLTRAGNTIFPIQIYSVPNSAWKIRASG